MTYTEIHEKVYSTGMALDLEDRLPWRIIKFFEERKHFSGWWDNIAPDIQDGIYDELRKLCEDNK